MNKQKFIDLLRKPHTATKDSVTELESVVAQYPYFQSAHMVLAKGSKNIKHPKTAKRISSAAVYCTDRALLKKYINDHIIFLDESKEEEQKRLAAIAAEEKRLKQGATKKSPEPTQKTDAKPAVKAEKAVQEKQQRPKQATSKQEEKPQKDTGTPTQEKQKPTEPKPTQGRNKIPPLDLKKSDFDADSIIDEMKIELEEYKKHKKHFDEWVQNEEERSAVEAALKKVTDTEKTEEPDVKEKHEELPKSEKEKPQASTENAPSDAVNEDITEIESVEPVKFTNAPRPKPKSSGYSSKILIEGSNKDTKKEEPAEETSKSAKSTRRVVKKVKEAPQPTAKKPETAPEEVVKDEKVAEASSEATEATAEKKPETSPEKEKAQKTTDSKAIKAEKAEDKPEKTAPSETKSKTAEKQEKAEKKVAEAEKEPAPKKSAKTEVKADTEEKKTKEEIPTPSEEESTSDSEASFNLDVNDDRGIINREEDKFDIKKDKKKAGRLRKEKLKKLREQRGIIDEFIEADPQMPSPRAKKPSPEEKKTEKPEEPKDLAAPSLQPDENIVSENLAIIYKNQGKPQKAIEIYEKLILKFPKKEAYFAARIEELKKS